MKIHSNDGSHKPALGMRQSLMNVRTVRHQDRNTLYLRNTGTLINTETEVQRHWNRNSQTLKQWLPDTETWIPRYWKKDSQTQGVQDIETGNIKYWNRNCHTLKRDSNTLKQGFPNRDSPIVAECKVPSNPGPRKVKPTPGSIKHSSSF